MATSLAAGVEWKSPKGRQILEGARAAFLELGYEGASTDEIVRRAGVSKGTLYNYFPDKRAMFAAVVEHECREHANRVFKIEGFPDNIETTLREVAIGLVRVRLSPSIQGIYRLAVAESTRFPELARIFYDSGPDLGARRLMQFLAGACARGDLVIEDVELAAYQFDQLCKADIFDKRLFYVQRSFSDEDIERVAQGAVEVFMRAYGAGRERAERPD